VAIGIVSVNSVNVDRRIKKSIDCMVKKKSLMARNYRFCSRKRRWIFSMNMFCILPLEQLNGIVAGNKIKVMLSLDDIEDLMGFVAAEANHTDDKKLQNTLDKIFTRLNDYLSKYDDQE